MTNFSPGDFITVNAPTHKDWHGRKGTIKQATRDGFITAVMTDIGKEQLLELMPAQLVKVIRDPGMEKFMGGLPDLLKTPLPSVEPPQTPAQQNAKQEELVSQANRDIRLFQIASTEGYMKGFREGYLRGYNEACADVNEIFRKNGLIPPKPGEPK